MEIVLAVQTLPSRETEPAEDIASEKTNNVEILDRFFATTTGAWEGEAIVRKSQGDYEERRWGLME